MALGLFAGMCAELERRKPRFPDKVLLAHIFNGPHPVHVGGRYGIRLL